MYVCINYTPVRGEYLSYGNVYKVEILGEKILV